MPVATYPSTRVHAERTIAFARVILTGTGLLAVWIDPDEPSRFAQLTYTLYLSYTLYAATLFLITLRWAGGEWLPRLTHAGDIVAFSLFQYLTSGPSSPFFIYSIFAMFSGAIVWGWRGTLITGATLMVAYVGMASWFGLGVSPSGFDLNRLIIRIAYIAIAIAMLVYLGRYEARLRKEIERLARWPAPLAGDRQTATERVLAYAARLMGAGRILTIWEAVDEPALYEARWTSTAGLTLTRLAPGSLPLFREDSASFSGSTFICVGPVKEATNILLAGSRGLVRRPGIPLHPAVLDRLEGSGVVTAPLRSDLISGRIFFHDVGIPPAEAFPLTDVVAREVAASLNQMHAAEQRQELATREDRIRVARDLHDGVLQGLTGVRLELRALAVERDKGHDIQQQLVTLERALAMEQRELRLFIDGLEPGSGVRDDLRPPLAIRLDSVRERIALEWKTPVTLRIHPEIGPLPAAVEDAVPLMVHEATVNALKHAQPSRVAVEVDVTEDRLRVAVSDDGRGFPFKGLYEHAALAASHLAPRSLIERVSALHGQLSIDSSAAGSRVEMSLPL